MENNKDKILNFTQWLIVVGILCGSRIEVLCLCIAIFLLFGSHKLLFSKNVAVIIGMIYILIISLITIFIYEYPLNKFIQQYLLIAVFLFGYSCYVYTIRDRIPDIFNKFVYIMKIAAVFGIIQYIIFYLSGVNIFKFIKPIGWTEWSQFRITSFLPCEPAKFAALLTPVLAYYLFGFKLGQKILPKVILLTACFLTFSFTTEIILFIMLLGMTFRYYKKLFYFIPICIILLFVFYSFSNFRGKDNLLENSGQGSTAVTLYNTVTDFSLYNIEVLSQGNVSVYAITKNLWVALNSPSRMFGTGLGTHEFSHDRLIINSYTLASLNREDAYSLGIRIFSEFGLLGFLVLIIFMFKYSNFSNIINLSVFFLLLSYILRGGNYVGNGTIYFFYLYYFTSKNNTNKLYYSKYKRQ